MVTFEAIPHCLQFIMFSCLRHILSAFCLISSNVCLRSLVLISMYLLCASFTIFVCMSNTVFNFSQISSASRLSMFVNARVISARLSFRGPALLSPVSTCPFFRRFFPYILSVLIGYQIHSTFPFDFSRQRYLSRFFYLSKLDLVGWQLPKTSYFHWYFGELSFCQWLIGISCLCLFSY